MGRTVSTGEVGAIVAPVLLFITLALGGGGSPAPFPELLLQILTALAFCWWLHRTPRALADVPSGAWWIAGLVAALHLLQLIPLPPAIWHVLPGRSSEVAALQLVGAELEWRPLSLSPPRTIASLLCALCALALLLMTATLGSATRWRLIGIVAISGAITLVLGTAQIKAESGSFLHFYNPAQVWLTGFFANRNSAADLLLVALIAWAAVAGRFRTLVPSPLSFAAMLIVVDLALLTGLFLTGSRAGIALAPIVLIAQFLILRSGSRSLIVALTFGATSAAAVLAAYLSGLRTSRVIALVIERFTLQGEFRPELWRDAAFALMRHWPFGSGQGTFVPVMIAAERLEVVDPAFPNRAHNDFLELAIEGGLPGLLVLTLAGTSLIKATRVTWRKAGPDTKVQTTFALATLLVLILHSLVDYPLRSMALAGVAAVAAGMLFPPNAARPGSSGSRKFES